MRSHEIPRLIALTLTAASSSGCGLFFGCGKDDSSDTPLSVSDWSVTQERYANIKNVVGDPAGTGDESGGGTGDTGGDTMAWDMLAADARCRWACAYALGETGTYASHYYDRTLTIESCELTIPTADADGTLSCTANLHITDVCIGGRRPLGWAPEPGAIADVQQQLDGMAMMEHVSITAFIELAAQLELRGAAAELVARCRAAADDERRHVAVLVALGAARPELTPTPAAPATSLLDIALHNAVEGCVTETWAALLARHQAQHADDPRVRAGFCEIADDEAVHAQLAWDLHVYFMQVLAPDAARELAGTLTLALTRLEANAMQQALALPRSVRERLGLPDAREAGVLARDFAGRLAAAA